MADRMERVQPIEEAAHRRRQFLVSRVHRGEAGVPARLGHDMRLEEGTERPVVAERAVGVESWQPGGIFHPLGSTFEDLDLVVEALPPVSRGLEFAELRGERLVLVEREQFLLAEEQHDMFEMGRADRRDLSLAQWPRQIDAAHVRAKVPAEAPNFNHWAFPCTFGCTCRDAILFWSPSQWRNRTRPAAGAAWPRPVSSDKQPRASAPGSKFAAERIPDVQAASRCSSSVRSILSKSTLRSVRPAFLAWMRTPCTSR